MEPKNLHFLQEFLCKWNFYWRQNSSISFAEKVRRKEKVSGLATRGQAGWRKLVIWSRFSIFSAGKTFFWAADRCPFGNLMRRSADIIENLVIKL